MNQYTLVALAIAYLLVLFAVASFVNRKQNFQLKNNPYVYTLSLAVYCSAWTFFGSVGRVSENGLDFLSIYLGPTLTMIAAWWLVLKIKKVSNYNRITSIADFLATRFGKSSIVGIVVTLVCLISAIPYVALQIKAISGALSALSFGTTDANASIYLTVLIGILLVFTLYFGSGDDTNEEQNDGLLAAISVESIVKLVVFLSLGIYITYLLFDGIEDLFVRNSQLQEPLTFDIFEKPGYGSFVTHTFLAGGAFLFLPRQFEITFVSFRDEELLKKATWLFPLYLLLINLFVIPIALSGNLTSITIPNINGDSFVIAIPLLFENKALAALAFLGGFSAATGMIIVESTAIGKMLSNNVIFPTVLKNVHFKENFNLAPLFYIRFFRRFSIVIVFTLGYLYFTQVTDLYSLTAIGLIAFTAIIQFLPAIFAGLYWEEANRKGVLTAIISGMLVWFFFLIHPSFVAANLLPESQLINELIGVLSSANLDAVSNATIISLVVNATVLIVVSSFTNQNAEERKSAELFINIEIYEKADSQNFGGEYVNLESLQNLFGNFVGNEQASRLLSKFLNRNQIPVTENVDSRVIDYVERVLGGIVGTVAAKIILSSIFKTKTVNIDEVIEILKESQSILSLNKELRKKSEQLENLTLQLQEANGKLQLANRVKAEFLTTVTHEIRTPLTSISALSEILIDNSDLSTEDRNTFLTNIINEIQRMVRLVNQVLDLERYETKNYVLKTEAVNLISLISELPIVKELTFSPEKQFTFSYNESQDYTFYCDTDKIKQVIINLLTNSNKFTKNAESQISLSLTKSNHNIEIEVTDNGVGIPENAIERIFDKFYQADNQDIRKPVGSGLGLSICKQIVELHQGSITVRSEKNTKTSFKIILPVELNNALT